MRILFLGSTSYAAQETVQRLRAAGHEVWTFDRRLNPDNPATALTGDPRRAVELCRAVPPCDVLINYLLLKGTDVAGNLAFCEQVAGLVVQQRVKRCIHLSSVIVADARHELVNEETPLERHVAHRPPYSRLKIETEHRLRERLQGCELVIVRPGFILGPGLADPMSGIGKRLPGQCILGMGWKRTIIPMIDRRLVDDAVINLCTLSLPTRETVVHLTDAVSPTRAEYLQYCASSLGQGRRVWHLPRWCWRLALIAATPLLAWKKRQWQNLPKMFAHNLSLRRFDATRSEKLLGSSFHRPWRDLVTAACENQQPNYALPAEPVATNNRSRAGKVLFVGLGRVVQERHLPALERMGFQGEVEWFDPQVSAPVRPTRMRLRRISSLAEATADSAVIATPAATRAALVQALPLCVRRVLFEKPFALSAVHREQLRAALGLRVGYVLHNYRFKSNSRELLGLLRATNGGRLLETRLHFDSPAVDHDSAAWMRDERRARTLLMDYGLHFADLALLLAQGPVTWTQVDSELNARGQTAWIMADGAAANHRCRLFLRQGARQRRCEVEYVFQNYSVILRFFPDTIELVLGSRTALDHGITAWRETGATVAKVLAKLGWRVGDDSHQRVLAAFLAQAGEGEVAALRLEALQPQYDALIALADRVYGPSS